MKQDIALPYKKDEKPSKTKIKKNLRKLFKDPPKNKIVLLTTYLGVVFAVVAMVLAFIPSINSLSVWLAVLAVALELFGFFRKDGLLPRRMLLASVVVLAVAVASVTIQNMYQQSLIDREMYLKSGDATEEIMRGDLSVSFAEWSENGLEVTLKNNNSDSKGYNVAIEAKDENGLQITNEVISVGGIASGKEAKLTIFKRLSDSQKEAMKNAKFEVSSASQF